MQSGVERERERERAPDKLNEANSCCSAGERHHVAMAPPATRAEARAKRWAGVGDRLYSVQ